MGVLDVGYEDSFVWYLRSIMHTRGDSDEVILTSEAEGKNEAEGCRYEEETWQTSAHI